MKTNQDGIKYYIKYEITPCIYKIDNNVITYKHIDQFEYRETSWKNLDELRKSYNVIELTEIDKILYNIID